MTRTKGNVIVEEIKVGDIHYEYEMGIGIKCEVLTKPTINEDGNWVWKSKNLTTDKEIDILADPYYKLEKFDNGNWIEIDRHKCGRNH
jgi:hypothetical protein